MKSIEFAKHLGTRLIFAVVLLLPVFAGFTSPVFADEDAGGRSAVYTITNEAEGNAVAVYEPAADGSLTFMAAYPTGGLGSGAGLGSQGKRPQTVCSQRRQQSDFSLCREKEWIGIAGCGRFGR